MTIGGSIALIILGAILAFAVTAEMAGVELSTVGLILMVGGVVGLLFGLTMRRRSASGQLDDPPL
ncbi:MAG: hypothetical protein WD041_02920 [Nitriliruptoraceae bacterium]